MTADDVTHDALLDIGGLETCPIDSLLHDHGTEIGGLDTCECLTVFSDGCPYCAKNHYFIH